MTNAASKSLSLLRLIFLGAPGTGKGTQASRLAKGFDIHTMSSGQMMRDQIAAETPLGKQVDEYVGAGRLIPDEVITDVILGAVAELGTSRGFVLDGFPRTVPQAEALRDGLATRETPIHAVIDFEMKPEDTIKRLSNRRVCSSCGATYNLLFFPPASEGSCDSCAGKLLQRADDREDVIETRLDAYRQNTKPLIEYYDQRKQLHRLNASQRADDVQADLVCYLSGLSA